MIFFGVALINKFDWIIYVFGAFLLITAFRMLLHKESEFDPKKSKMFRFLKKLFPVSHKMDGDKFFIKRMGVRAATPLFVALIIIELTDILFALDSIPAILAITADPFIVFSSNILAILGLRSMYFLISRMLTKFRLIQLQCTKSTPRLLSLLPFVCFPYITNKFIKLCRLVSCEITV